MRYLIAVMFSAVLATAALAQKVGPNGGKIGGKDGHETELVLSPSEITVYLIDDGKAESTKGAAIRAVIQAGGATTTVQLVDTQGKKLIGKLSAPLAKGAVVVISGKDGHGHAVNARYVID